LFYSFIPEIHFFLVAEDGLDAAVGLPADPGFVSDTLLVDLAGGVLFKADFESPGFEPALEDGLDGVAAREPANLDCDSAVLSTAFEPTDFAPLSPPLPAEDADRGFTLSLLSSD
jgi:hypothetical protein